MWQWNMNRSVLYWIYLEDRVLIRVLELQNFVQNVVDFSQINFSIIIWIFFFPLRLF